MTTHDFSDETLMAFADGELDDADMERVEAAMNDDPALAERVALFMEARELAEGVFARQLAQPAPPSLQAAVERMIAAPAAPATVMPFQAKGRVPAAANENRRGFARFAMAAAASVAIVAAGLAGYMAGQGSAPAGSAQVALIDVPGLDDALLTTASGDTTEIAGAGTLTAVSTFTDGADRVCREFELASEQAFVGIACRATDDWQLTFAMGTGSADGTGYQPASSLDTLDAYLTGIEAGAPLSLEEEAAALAALR